MHLVRRRVSVSAVTDKVVAQRDVVAAAFAGRWGRSLGYAAANRMLDYAALVASLYAVGARARPSMVLLAYVISLGLALVPITPGGLGFVEAGLTTILVLAGVGSDQAVLATLLYRLVSYWLPIPVGAFAYAGWHLHLRPQPGKIDQFDPCRGLATKQNAFTALNKSAPILRCPAQCDGPVNRRCSRLREPPQAVASMRGTSRLERVRRGALRSRRSRHPDR